MSGRIAISARSTGRTALDVCRRVCAGGLAALLLQFVPAAAARSQSVRVTEALTTANVRTEESYLASVVADAIRASAKTDVALIAATSFADTTIPAGNASPADFERALLFRGDTVVVLRLPGAQLKQALEHGLSLYPARSAAFLQVSGLSYELAVGADRGSRVTNLKIGKEPLNETRVYTVAMPSPLAGGALVYSKAWSRSDIERDTKVTLDEALKSYLAAIDELPQKTGGRIVVRK